MKAEYIELIIMWISCRLSLAKHNKIWLFKCVHGNHYNEIYFMDFRWAATVQDLVILDELLNKGYDRRATPTNHLSTL